MVQVVQFLLKNEQIFFEFRLSQILNTKICEY